MERLFLRSPSTRRRNGKAQRDVQTSSGLPFFLSGETPDWKHLAHRTEFPGIEILTNHLATSIDPKNKTVWIKDKEGPAKLLNYDKLIIGIVRKELDRKGVRVLCGREIQSVNELQDAKLGFAEI